jgi:ABC-type phosphonate transport system ATPase subunit
MTRTSQPAAEPARIFEDRMYRGEWRVEWLDDRGGVEVAVFSGPNAQERALRYADRQYGYFEEIRFGP